MAFRDFVARLIGKTDPGQIPGADSAAQTSEVGKPGVGTTDPFRNAILQSLFTQKPGLFNVATERKAIYDECEMLDDAFPEICRALDAIAEHAVSSESGDGIAVRVTFGDGDGDEDDLDADANEASMDRMFSDTQFHQRAFDMARGALKYGDRFEEVVIGRVGGEYRIVRLKALPPKTMDRREDPFGNLRRIAFIQRDPMAASATGTLDSNQPSSMLDANSNVDQLPGNTVAQFYQWQMIHLRWMSQGDHPYGRTHIWAARRSAKRLLLMEDSLCIARLQHAYNQRVHYVDVTTAQNMPEVDAMIEQRKKSIMYKKVTEDDGSTRYLDADLIVATDIFVPVRDGHNPPKVGVDLLHGQGASLSNTEDVNFFQRKILNQLAVPPGLLGWERDINAKATLGTQYRNFARIVRRVQAMLSVAAARLIDLQLTLDGKIPAECVYSIRWPNPSTEDSRDIAQVNSILATTQLVYRGAGIFSRKAIATGRATVPPDMTDEEWAAMRAEVEEEQEQDVEDAAAFADRMSEEGNVPPVANDVLDENDPADADPNEKK